MDPLISFATRNSNTFPVLTYDGRYVYERDSFTPTFDLSTSVNQNVYAAPELLTMLEEEKSSFFVPERDNIVFERSNPFIKVKGYVNNAEMKAFELLFNFKGTKIVLNPIRRHLKQVITDGLLVETPYNNLLLALPMAVNNVWMQLVYLMTKIYKRVTLLQLAMSDVRYLIAMEYTGIPNGWHAELKNVASFESSSELSQIFSVVPSCFSAWYTFMNNIHIAKVVETLLLTKAQKDAKDGGGIYTSMPSYDFKKVINLLTGQPLIQDAIKSKSFKFMKEVDEEFVRGLHLYGEPVNFSGKPVHTTIDLETDIGMSYTKGYKVAKGGIHWGQRKLLLSEIDFFTHHLEPNEYAVVYYIGAAPFEHGTILLEMFPTLTFVLCDPRDVWSAKIKEEARKSNPKIIIECEWITAKHIDQIIQTLSSNDPSDDPKIKAMRKVSKIFFVSDIRSTSTTEVGTVDNELQVHSDMLLQQKLVQTFGNAMTSVGKEFVASLKFRLPFINEIGGIDYPYIGGILKTQPWSRTKSTELRLWWRPTDEMKTYNKKKIEDVMMYHNSVLRDGTFGTTNVLGYCECHDCHYEVSIIKSYIDKFATSHDLALKEMILGYVSLFDETLQMSLAEHADRDRKKVSGFIVQKNLVTKSLRYNPLVENIRSNHAFEHRAECVRIMKAAPEFENIADEVLNQIFSTSLLSGYYETGKYVGEIIPDIVLELCNVTMSDTTKSKLKAQIGIAESKRSSSLNELSSQATIEVYSSNLGSNNRGYYKISTRDDKPVSTIGFHKDVIRRFLQGNEKKYDMSLSELRREKVIMSKMYSFLKRIGPAWHDHLAYSLDEFWDTHPDLPGFYNGGCILNTKRETELTFSDNYGTLIPELELGLSENVNILQLKSLIIDARVVTIFAPPIRHLWILFLNKANDILHKYSNDDKVVVIIMPSKYVGMIPEALSVFEHEPSRSQYSSKAFNTMKSKTVDLNDHIVRVFRTSASEFSLAKD